MKITLFCFPINKSPHDHQKKSAKKREEFKIIFKGVGGRFFRVAVIYTPVNRIIKLSPQGKCQDILDEFAQQTSQFIFCANKNAKPIQMCRQCASFFIDLSSNYQVIILFCCP